MCFLAITEITTSAFESELNRIGTFLFGSAGNQYEANDRALTSGRTSGFVLAGNSESRQRLIVAQRCRWAESGWTVDKVTLFLVAQVVAQFAEGFAL
jgi:hypothetical protein